MASILLVTLNARYIHSSLGLRYLLANMSDLRSATELVEFVIQERPEDVVEKLLAKQPRIVGFGVYIWNVDVTTRIVALLKALRPDITVVLGGPEVSYEQAGQAIVEAADYVIAGQADLAFAALCRQVLSGNAPPGRFIEAPRPELSDLAFPYSYYSDADIAHRVIYVEASRGCPYKCEFCLSALDKTAWPFELEPFLAQLDSLYQRGARQFKFVDRTFNLNIQTSVRILEFFLERMDGATFVHFELIPDRLPEALKAVIAQFPPGALQFEIGVQTFNPQVQALISRRQDNAKTVANLHWLRQQTQAHLHADLIVGLPGESLQSFAAGFDQLVALDPHEIQVGILKRLRGAPIARHSDAFSVRYNPAPPYNIISSNLLDFETLQRLVRFARYWDLIGNSGRFRHVRPLLLGAAPFARFLQLSDWLYETTGQTHQIALDRLYALLYRALTELFGVSADAAQTALASDHQCSGLKGPLRLPHAATASAATFPAPDIVPPTMPPADAAGGRMRQLRHRRPS